MSKPTIESVHLEFSKHEVLCSQRWTETLSRIKRLETVLLASAGSIILLLIGLLVK